MSDDVQSEISAFIRDANQRGLTIVESIKLVRERFGFSLAEAKIVVTAEACWEPVVKATVPLHEEITRVSGIDGGDQSE